MSVGKAGAGREQRPAGLHGGVSSHRCLLGFGANTGDISFTRHICRGALPASPGAGVGARAGCAVRDPQRGKENFLHFGVKRDKPRFARRGGHIKSRASCEGPGLSPKAPATASISFISPPAIYFTFCLLV